MSDEAITVDDIVTGKAAQSLGTGVIATSAILIVETLSDAGVGLRYVKTEGMPTWHAIGLVRSAQLVMEAIDLANWYDDEDDE